MSQTQVRAIMRSMSMLLLCISLSAFSQTTPLNPPDSAKDSLMEAQILDASWGMHVKLVWERSVVPAGVDLGPNHVLLAFDTDEKKLRVLQSTPERYDRPLITRDGTRVIWNDMEKGESWICNWDGSGKRLLLKGNTTTIAANITATRWDSVENKHYVYVGIANGAWGNLVEQPRMYSYPLNGLTVDTTQKKVVWDSAAAGSGLCAGTYFQVSADGKYAVGQMSGGINCLGFLDLAQQKIVETRLPSAGGLGCDPNIIPDNSRMWWHHMAGHSYIHIYRYGGTDNSIWVRPDSLYPNMGVWSYSGLELPRQSNHPRFFVGSAAMAFPSDTNWNLATFKYQFYLERFDAGFTKIEKIVQVSHSPRSYSSTAGDAWFDMGSSTDVRSNHVAPSIKMMGQSIPEGVAYDIQGRKIPISNALRQKTSIKNSTGVCIEHGKLRLMVR